MVKSVEAVFLRIHNLDINKFYKNSNCGVVLLADSKVNLFEATRNIFKQLREYAPGNKRITIIGPNGSTINMHVVLTGIQCDFAARTHVACHLNAVAYLGCMFCCLNGE